MPDLSAQNWRKVYAANLTLSRDNGGLETMTLRLCRKDSPIEPSKTAYYYESRISSMPFYKQRIQEVRSGRSQRSFGHLELDNSDGFFDPYLAGWTWQGGLIELSLGGPDDNVVDFEPVYTARMSTPRATDRRLSLPITDRQIDFYNAIYTDAGSTDTVANHVDAMLSAVGGITKDSALWSAFSSDNAFNAYLEANDEKISTLLDRLLAPLAVWYGFDRSGQFIIGTFQAPDGSAPDLILNLPDGFDLDVLDFQYDQIEQIWKLDVEYISATSPLAYSTVTRNDASIKTINPNADYPPARRTLLTSSTDAATIRDRWWDLLSVPRSIIKPVCKMQGVQLRPHMQVAIERGRYGVTGNYRVLGFQEDYDNNRVTLEHFK